MKNLFIILLVALVPMMALDAGGAELRKDKKAKTEKVNKKKKKGKVKEVVVGYGADDPDFIDDGLMNGLPPCNHDSTAASNPEQEYELVKTKGAAAALPMFERFMKAVLADSSLPYSKKVQFAIPKDFDMCGDQLPFERSSSGRRSSEATNDDHEAIQAQDQEALNDFYN